jgi:hypothetical protein
MVHFSQSPAMPIPPNNVPDADLKTLVDWILAAK